LQQLITHLGGNARFRRIILLAAHPSEGRFSRSPAAIQAWRLELVFMPLNSHCRQG